MSEWRLGRPVGEPHSIWRRPAQAGLLVGAVFVALAVITMPPGVGGTALVAILLGRLIEGFIIGFFAAVILLTYSSVARRD